MKNKASLWGSALSAGAALGGYWCAVEQHYLGDPPNLGTSSAVIALGMMALSLIPPENAYCRKPDHQRKLTASMIVYVLVLFVSDAFFVRDNLPSELILRAALLAPLITVTTILLRRRAVMAAVGCALFIFAATVVLTGTTRVSGQSGMVTKIRV